MKQRLYRKRRSAFTLVEIMVAAAITIIMIGLVIQITSEVLKVWNRSVGKLSANAEARIAMELLTNDLESILLVNNGQQWLRVESEANVGNPIVGQTVGLKLFAPAMDRPKIDADGVPIPGNICGIAYRLALAPAYGSNPANNNFILYRSLLNSKDTFNDLMGPSQPNNPQLELTENSNAFWSASQITEENNYLAGNIVNFKIFIYGIDSSGDEVILNSEDGVTIDDDYIYGGTDSNEEVPLYAEIFLTIVSDEGLDILILPSLSGTGYSNVDDVVREHGEVFKRRVDFQAKPL
ncbi:MAG: PulJ/GspJ family protein [Opitutales bacterium]